MSTYKEKIEAIKHAIAGARREVERLELIKSVSQLHKSQEYQLDMAKETVRRGEAILNETGEE